MTNPDQETPKDDLIADVSNFLETNKGSKPPEAAILDEVEILLRDARGETITLEDIERNRKISGLNEAAEIIETLREPLDSTAEIPPGEIDQRSKLWAETFRKYKTPWEWIRATFWGRDAYLESQFIEMVALQMQLDALSLHRNENPSAKNAPEIVNGILGTVQLWTFMNQDLFTVPSDITDIQARPTKLLQANYKHPLTKEDLEGALSLTYHPVLRKRVYQATESTMGGTLYHVELTEKETPNSTTGHPESLNQGYDSSLTIQYQKPKNRELITVVKSDPRFLKPATHIFERITRRVLIAGKIMPNDYKG